MCRPTYPRHRSKRRGSIEVNHCWNGPQNPLFPDLAMNFYFQSPNHAYLGLESSWSRPILKVVFRKLTHFPLNFPKTSLTWPKKFNRKEKPIFYHGEWLLKTVAVVRVVLRFIRQPRSLHAVWRAPHSARRSATIRSACAATKVLRGFIFWYD